MLHDAVCHRAKERWRADWSSKPWKLTLVLWHMIQKWWLPYHQPMEQLSPRAVKTSDLILDAPPWKTVMTWFFPYERLKCCITVLWTDEYMKAIHHCSTWAPHCPAFLLQYTGKLPLSSSLTMRSHLEVLACWYTKQRLNMVNLSEMVKLWTLRLLGMRPSCLMGKVMVVWCYI